jgi:hypothetical protein
MYKELAQRPFLERNSKNQIMKQIFVTLCKIILAIAVGYAFATSVAEVLPSSVLLKIITGVVGAAISYVAYGPVTFTRELKSSYAHACKKVSDILTLRAENHAKAVALSDEFNRKNPDAIRYYTWKEATDDVPASACLMGTLCMLSLSPLFFSAITVSSEWLFVFTISIIVVPIICYRDTFCLGLIDKYGMEIILNSMDKHVQKMSSDVFEKEIAKLKHEVFVASVKWFFWPVTLLYKVSKLLVRFTTFMWRGRVGFAFEIVLVLLKMLYYPARKVASAPRFVSLAGTITGYFWWWQLGLPKIHGMAYGLSVGIGLYALSLVIEKLFPKWISLIDEMIEQIA